MANENRGLQTAKRNKKDEFYTQLVDIERELRHYRSHFKGMVVYCNCDDPYVSAFFEYFTKNFEFLRLNGLITTCYRSKQMNLFSQNDSEQAIKLEYTGGAPNSLPTPDDIGVTTLMGDGDFRSQECIDILKKADIVVTNPPFSLFSEYVAQLASFDKKFIIIGHQNAITYKGIFPLLKENRMWCQRREGLSPKRRNKMSPEQRLRSYMQKSADLPTTSFWHQPEAVFWENPGDRPFVFPSIGSFRL